MKPSSEHIVQGALEVLTALTPGKPWLTARSIARRMRARPGGETVTQLRVFRALLEEAARGVGARRVRNSRLPSVRTLEVLWAAVQPVGTVRDLDVESPILHRPFGSGASEQPAEDGAADDEPPTCFMSYNMNDSRETEGAIDVLEARGYSVWFAGTSIQGGDNIHSAVIEALGNARRHFVYLSEHSLRSLWVGKEVIVGAAQGLALSVIVNADDVACLELARRLVDDGCDVLDLLNDRYPGSESRDAVRKFQQILVEHVCRPDAVVYYHATRTPGDMTEHPRLRPLDEIPNAP